jgi:hypothetical protein
MRRVPPALPHGWRSVLIVTWLLAFAGTLAVAVSSRTVGRPVWWLGPSAAPAPAVAMLVPVATVLVPLVAAVRSWRRAPSVSILCSLLLIAVAVPDAPDRLAVAVGAWTVGAAVLLTNIGVMVGMRQYR